MGENQAKQRLGWLWIPTILLAIALLVVSVLWGVQSSRNRAQAQVMTDRLENTYRQSYYQLSYSLGNLSDQLNKLTVATSPTMQRQLLGQINTYAVQAATALQGVGDVENTRQATKCLNQVGDYALHLQYGLGAGGLTVADRDNLASLYTAVCQLERNLAELRDQVDEDGFSFVRALGDGQPFSEALSALDAQSVSYPSLIYDGPFSDALTHRTPLALTGDPVSRDEAQALAAVYLPYRGQTTYEGELAGDIEAYRFRVETSWGTYWVAVTKQGGLPAGINCDAAPTDTVYDEQEAVNYGLDYLRSIGLDKMQAVWVSNYNSVYYVNYAYTQDDVIVYSDLIVLKIDAQTKRLVGMESLNYLYNHTTRTLPTPAIDRQQALSAVHEGLTVDSVRLSLVPTEGGLERLCYEVYGTMGNDQYFVYVDAQTGEEYKIMRVIDSGQGELVV